MEDAVRRILTAKVALGLFETPLTDESLVRTVGSAEHRALAREAARKSAVLLKNDGDVLPLKSDLPFVLVAGEAADDVGAQCGGWTITWMGGRGDITPGTTILEGFKRAYPGPARVHYSRDGEVDGHYPVAVAVVAEEPYAEGMGDRTELRLSDDQLAMLDRVRAKCDRLVVVLLSGRPLVITDHLPRWDAFVAAWLPGTEGDGVAEVLCGAAPFTGRLGYDWPRSHADLPRTSTSEALWTIGEGLTTQAYAATS